MISASAYILKVPSDRREILLTAERSHFGGAAAAEPVKLFDHSRRAPLIVLASFDDGLLTHIASARKGASAGTGLVRLNMNSLDQLEQSIPFQLLINSVPNNVKATLTRVVEAGGVLPPQTAKAVVAALEQIDPSLTAKLARLSIARAEQIAALGPKKRENLALQKEALTTALQVAGIDSGEVLDWSPNTVEPTSFLEGLPEVRVREDVMLHADLTMLPGFSVLREAPYLAARTFVAEDDSANRVTVIMANRLPLEEQTGADLIYFNETFRSFVLVQYKALEKAAKQHEFRWGKGDQFEIELVRMDSLLEELDQVQPDSDPDGFRLTSNPFFLKFCPRIVFNPDDKGMFPGLYLPLGLWKALATSDRLKGPSGGNLLTYENVGRRVSNSEFVTFVGGAWVGTTIGQSAHLDKLIRSVLESGRTVAFAVKRLPPPEPMGETVEEPLLGEGALAEPEEIAIAVTN
ncbi:MAG: hypothetical protein J0G34_10145 [Afipia sp.]|nr:hypothetical protein [Afipia sp.]